MNFVEKGEENRIAKSLSLTMMHENGDDSKNNNYYQVDNRRMPNEWQYAGSFFKLKCVNCDRSIDCNKN